MKHQQSPELVRIVRAAGLEDLICHVYQSSNDCIIASELSDSLDLDGLCILPTRSVRILDRTFERAAFYKAALGAWPEAHSHAALLSELTCNVIRDLRLLAARKQMIAIHMEIDDPDVCFVGIARDVADDEMVFDTISADGRPTGEPMKIRIESVTKIEFATRYLTAVAHAVGVADVEGPKERPLK